MSKESKPGYRTTEFWITLIVGFYTFLNTTGAIDELPKTWSTIALAILAGAYAVGRGVAKQGIPFDPPTKRTSRSRE